MPAKPEIIRIRCGLKTRKKFRIYAAEYKTLEDALLALLEAAEKLKKIEPSRVAVG